MIQDHYSREEIDKKFIDIHKKLDILLAWKNYIAGGIAILTALGMPIAGWALIQVQLNAIDVSALKARFPEGVSASVINNTK